jgi:hypothetical protein
MLNYKTKINNQTMTIIMILKNYKKKKKEILLQLNNSFKKQDKNLKLLLKNSNFNLAFLTQEKRKNKDFNKN